MRTRALALISGFVLLTSGFVSCAKPALVLPTGTGVPGAFPPLTKSHYVNGSVERFASIILKGNNPPFVIEGKTYVVPMPPQEAALDDTKIASIMTFVRASFENSGGLVTPEMVAAARKKFADRKDPWKQEELDAWKD